MRYHHLTLEERKKLALLSENCYVIRAIAQELGRSPSTISRELERNACYQEGLGRLIVFYQRTSCTAAEFTGGVPGSMEMANCPTTSEGICCKPGRRAVFGWIILTIAECASVIPQSIGGFAWDVWSRPLP